jgi:hypothetical protein
MKEGRSQIKHQIKLVLVSTKEQRTLYYGLVKNHHSYVTAIRHVGRHIGWLVYYDEKLIGCIGLGSYFLPEPKVLKDFIGWEKEAFNENFNKIANNWRFTLTKEAPKNSASRVLAIVAKIAPKIWQEKYGDPLVAMVSLVGNHKEGTCFKAAGWQMIGMTAGSTAHGSISVKKSWKKKGFIYVDEDYINNQKKLAEEKGEEYTPSYKRSKKEQKMIFIKPIHQQWRLILTSVKVR